MQHSMCRWIFVALGNLKPDTEATWHTGDEQQQRQPALGKKEIWVEVCCMCLCHHQAADLVLRLLSA